MKTIVEFEGKTGYIDGYVSIKDKVLAVIIIPNMNRIEYVHKLGYVILEIEEQKRVNKIFFG